MAKEAFVDIALRPSSLKVIEQANAIIDVYQAAGYTLTLRQLFYQFVSRALIANKQSEYKRLGNIVDQGRKAGLIDWAAIEDRTRFLRRLPTWESPEQIIRGAAYQYREDWWTDQTHYVEVWIEKDALVGVIEGVCEEFQVPYFACRGYASQSELYEAGKRLYRRKAKGQRPVILHLGDHDPSGIDMTRDLAERLELFSYGPVLVKRLALNMDQVEQYDPPPNPAKMTDSRFTGYEEQFGSSSWELDALEPQVISDLIRENIEGYLDTAYWEEAQEREQANKENIRVVSERWAEVVEHVEEQIRAEVTEAAADLSRLAEEDE